MVRSCKEKTCYSYVILEVIYSEEKKITLVLPALWEGLSDQGGEGEVVGQLSCIYGTITTKSEKKLKKNLFNFLNFQIKINFEKKFPK